MGSLYLKPNDFVVYGVDPSTTVAEIISASSMIDTFLDRPEGIIYVPDIDGNPCYMAAKDPIRSFALTVGTVAGSNTLIPLAANFSQAISIGAVVILDRDTALMEACRVTAVTATSITLFKTVRPHSIGCKVDLGMVNCETRNIPSKRSIARVSRFPLVRLLSACGKYEYGRRSDQAAGLYADANLLATIQTFGGPPSWNPFDPSGCDINETTCEIWIPAGMLVAYYSQVQLWYLSGYLEANLPRTIKSVCAKLIRSAQNMPEELGAGNIQSVKAGDTEIRRFKDSFLDMESKSQLNQFKVKALF